VTYKNSFPLSIYCNSIGDKEKEYASSYYQ
jgi:hypothetical protein